MEKHTSVETPFVICGDFNIGIMKDNQLIKDYKNVIQSNGFELFETLPTRVTISSMSCIDHIIQKNCVPPKFFVLEYQSFSDHYHLTNKWKTTQNCSEVNTFRDTSFLKSPAKVKHYMVTLHEHLKSFRSYIVEAVDAD